MPQDWPKKLDHIPLLAAEKHYFKLDEEGRLQYFLYNQAEERWEMLSANLFQQKLHGFDAAVDQQDAVHLLGYEHEGGLFHLAPPLTDQGAPLLLYRDKHKTIDHLSTCRDQKNNLHVLYLTSNKQYAMWWLFYLRHERQKWTEPRIIDFGYGPPEQYGLIGTDFQNRIFILYRLYTAEKYNLAFRLLEGSSHRPGKTVFLQERKGECLFPSFLVDPDNTLHLSWTSRTDGSMFLNYACRAPTGKWGNFFNLEMPPGSFFLAPLFRYADKLLLTWRKDWTLSHLYSLQGNKNWRWGKNQTATKELQLLRLRTVDNPGENFPFRGNCLFTTTGSPPQKILQAQAFLPHVPAENEEEKEIPQELHILDILSSYTLTRASNLQAANTHLKQKLEQQEKEFLKLYTAGLAQTESLGEKLAAKNMELKDVEKLLQQTLAELQERMQQQRKEIATLQAQCGALQKENEKLKKNNLIKAANLARLKKEVMHLTQENEAQRAEKLKKTSFLPGLFQKIRR